MLETGNFNFAGAPCTIGTGLLTSAKQLPEQVAIVHIIVSFLSKHQVSADFSKRTCRLDLPSRGQSECWPIRPFAKRTVGLN